MGDVNNKNDSQDKQSNGWTAKTNCPYRYNLQVIYEAKWAEDRPTCYTKQPK